VIPLVSLGPACRIIAPDQCRARVLFAGGALREREWDHADGPEQNQVKGGSKQMRFNVWVSLFFHSDLILFLSLVFSHIPGCTCFHVFLPLHHPSPRFADRSWQNSSEIDFQR
jgi:hypothetical protein